MRLRHPGRTKALGHPKGQLHPYDRLSYLRYQFKRLFGPGIRVVDSGGGSHLDDGDCKIARNTEINVQCIFILHRLVYG